MGDYKLIIGRQHDPFGCDMNMWSPLDYPCTNGSIGEDCDPYCLFNLVQDPYERNNLVDTEKATLQKLLDHYNTYSKEPREMQDQGYHHTLDLPTAPIGDLCKFMRQHGGYWQPGMDESLLSYLDHTHTALQHNVHVLIDDSQ